MWPLKLRQYNEYDLVVDVGSASIGLGLVRFSKEGIPQIVYTTRIPLVIAEKPTYDTFLPKLLLFLKKGLQNFTEELENKQLRTKAIRHVHIFYASPWYRARTKRASFKEKRPIKINQLFIDKILQTQKNEFLKDNNILSDDSRLTIIEEKILDVRLNGYKTNNPIGKNATSVELAFYIGTVPDKIIKNVEDTLRDVIRHKRIYHHTFPLAAYSSILDVFPHDNTFLHIDITGEITDIYLVREDVLEKTVTFPSGRNLLIRIIAEKFNVSSSGALSYLDLYLSGNADTKFADLMQNAVQSVGDEWNIFYNDAVEYLCVNTPIPHKIFTTVDKDVEKFYSNLMKEHTDSLAILNEDMLKHAVSVDRRAREDVFIILETLFVEKLHFLN